MAGGCGFTRIKVLVTHKCVGNKWIIFKIILACFCAVQMMIFKKTRTPMCIDKQNTYIRSINFRLI